MSPRVHVRKRADFDRDALRNRLIAEGAHPDDAAELAALLVAWRPIARRLGRIVDGALVLFAIDVAFQIGRAFGWWRPW